MTVEEMLNRMTSAELVSWRAFSQVEMIGPDREDLRAGIVASAVYNANRASRASKVHKPIDHMPFQKAEKENAHKAMSVEQQVAAVFGSLMARQKG